MNKYCTDIKLDIDPIISFDLLKTLPDVYFNRVPLDWINPEIKELFVRLNLRLFIVAYLKLNPNEVSLPHADDPLDVKDMAKLNFSYGPDHLMTWYKFRQEDIPQGTTYVIKATNTEHGGKYTIFSYDDLTELHSQVVGKPSIIQAGIPHGVKNYNQTRHCFSIPLRDQNLQPIPMATALSIFEKFL